MILEPKSRREDKYQNKLIWDPNVYIYIYIGPPRSRTAGGAVRGHPQGARSEVNRKRRGPRSGQSRGAAVRGHPQLYSHQSIRQQASQPAPADQPGSQPANHGAGWVTNLQGRRAQPRRYMTRGRGHPRRARSRDSRISAVRV
jgi:hypothetical protein